MSSDAANQWTTFYTTNTEMMYPAEAVIRIFKGTYPNLTMRKPKPRQTILDVGCGDGRHFPFFQSLDLRVSGSEITDQIVSVLAARLSEIDTEHIDLRVGTCASLPWPDASFDYLLAWNSCYYMNTGAKFEDHVAEMARVIKPGGWLICSVPRIDCFIFKNARYNCIIRHAIIQEDYFGLRNGEELRYFLDQTTLEEAFTLCFTDFSHATIDIDMFGLSYTWHVFTARKRIP